MSIGSPLNSASEFPDLSDDDLLAILDDLPFRELVNKADLSPRLRQLIRKHHMIPKYRIDKVNVSFTNCAGSRLYEDHIVVCKYDTILKFFRSFGDLITKLNHITRNDKFSPEEMNAINEHVIQYCSKTLNELTLYHPTMALLGKTRATSPYPELDYIYKPSLIQFERVTKLTIWNFKSSDHLEIDKIFPVLESLHFDTVKDVNNLRSLARHYPQLNELKMIAPVPLKRDAPIFHLFELNPQLRSLDLNTYPNELLLIYIQSTLRKLTTLKLGGSQIMLTEVSDRVL